MAKFNEKVMCLFQKDYKQLKKEAERRGMCHNGREKTIAKILWKDAYDAGYNDGVAEGRNRSVQALGNAIRNCPANCCGNAKPETREYCFEDCNEMVKYRFELTEDQARAIQWFIDHGFFAGEVDFSEWDDTFEDVGRI